MDYNASVISFFTISSEVFAAMNLPASVFNILLNTFFIYCMVFQQHEQEQLKQPLNVLQGILVGCNITVSVSTLLKVFLNLSLPSWNYMPYVFSQCGVYSMMTSVSSSFWRNVFYYCQITTAKSHFIWLKKNICAFIYCALLINGIIYLFELSLNITIILILQINSNDNDTNTSFATNDNFSEAIFIWYIVYGMTLGLLILNLCGMSTSSCATVIFLWKHLKKMEEINTLSSSRFQRQIRMTTRSIAIHALLNFICSLGVIVDSSLLMYFNSSIDSDENILCTLVSFYAFGSTINLGFSQSLFRQQLAYAWKKMFPMF